MKILFPVDGGAFRLEPDGWRSGPDTRGVRLHPADAARLVERHFYGEPGTLRLRALVGARRYAVQYWTDHEVRAEVARLVAGGAWTVWKAPAMPAAARFRRFRRRRTPVCARVRAADGNAPAGAGAAARGARG
jgi:hypothetical protein